MKIASAAIVSLAVGTLAFALVAYWNIRVASRDEEHARRIGHLPSERPESRIPGADAVRPFSAILAGVGAGAKPAAVLAAFAGIGLIVGGLLYPALGLPGPLLGVACAAVGVRAFAVYREAKRAKAFGRQLPDMLLMAAQNLSAGMSVETAFASVARFAPQPAKDEFQKVSDEVRFGRIPIDKALERMAARTGDKEAGFLAVAVGVQKIGGGNLAELLQSTAMRIESKQELQGDIDAITSQGRYASKFIALFPFLVLGTVVFGAPDIGAAFWASPYWPFVLAALAALDAAALVAVRRIYRMPTD